MQVFNPDSRDGVKAYQSIWRIVFLCQLIWKKHRCSYKWVINTAALGRGERDKLCLDGTGKMAPLFLEAFRYLLHPRARLKKAVSSLMTTLHLIHYPRIMAGRVAELLRRLSPEAELMISNPIKRKRTGSCISTSMLFLLLLFSWRNL